MNELSQLFSLYEVERGEFLSHWGGDPVWRGEAVQCKCSAIL